MIAARYCLLVLGLCLLWAPRTSHGFPGDVPERLQLQLGSTLATLDTSVGLGIQGGGLGTTIVFENLLNLPVSARIGRADAWWHLRGHSNLDLGFFALDRENSARLQEDVEFGGYTFRANALVTGKINSSFVYVAYRHDFLRLEPVRINGSLGASIMTLGANLQAAAGIVDSTGREFQGEAEIGERITFPVPLLGLQVDWAVSRRGVIQFIGRFFYLNTGTLRGSMNESAIRYCYYPWRHWGIGAGFDKMSINIPKLETGDSLLRANYTIQGLSAYLRYSF